MKDYGKNTQRAVLPLVDEKKSVLCPKCNCNRGCWMDIEKFLWSIGELQLWVLILGCPLPRRTGKSTVRFYKSQINSLKAMSFIGYASVIIFIVTDICVIFHCNLSGALCYLCSLLKFITGNQCFTDIPVFTLD